jgi:integrase
MQLDKLTDKQKLLVRLAVLPDDLSTAQLLAVLQTRAGDEEPDSPGHGDPTNPNAITPYRQAWLDELADELPLDVMLRARKTLPATPTRDEIHQLLEAPSPEDRTGPRDRLIMRTLYATGIRLAELCALKFCDLDYGGQSVFVRDGKGAKDRYVLADAQTMTMLKEWQGDQGPEAPVFDVGDRQIERLVTQYGTQTGLTQKYAAMGRGLSPHSFRHAYATHLYETGVDLFTLKRWMGHAFLDVTENYIETAIRRTLGEYEKHHQLSLDAAKADHTEV